MRQAKRLGGANPHGYATGARISKSRPYLIRIDFTSIAAKQAARTPTKIAPVDLSVYLVRRLINPSLYSRFESSV